MLSLLSNLSRPKPHPTPRVHQACRLSSSPKGATDSYKPKCLCQAGTSYFLVLTAQVLGRDKPTGRQPDPFPSISTHGLQKGESWVLGFFPALESGMHN